MRRARLVIAWLAPATLACGGLFDAGPPLAHELAGAERDAAVALGDDVADGRFPEAIVGTDPESVMAACAAHGPAFVWLAARDERPGVRAAAATATRGCLAAVDHGDAAVAARIGTASADAPERAAAYALAGELLAEEPADADLLATIERAVREGPPADRYEALAALDRYGWGSDPEATAAMEAALRAEQPWLVTEALRRLRYRASGVSDPAGLAAACRALASDVDPGLRGRAALALARLTPDDPEVPGLLVGLLADPHPFTRSAAAEALGDLAYLPAAHDLVSIVDDQAPNTWDHLPFQRLDGSMVVQHHVGSLHERVDDAVLRALEAVTAGLPEASRFTYREVHPGKWRDLDILAAGRDAKKWYEAHGSELPTH